MTDPLTAEWAPAQVAVMHGLRDWVVDFTELNQHFATWLDLPGSDANALGQITWAAETGAPLSPVRLARRIGLTTGATTVLLNRLEAAGHVHRSRESADRRRVTLRPSAGARERAREFLAFAGAEIAATLRAADPDELDVVIGFLARITAAAAEANQRLGRPGGSRGGRGS
ncbi:MarR family winged helix-turn-helix transcriptional regulator [Amycolatopsis sp. FBCC-B4732]|uniref:MarR family winged helix-turn-helix transcriptional regulator n=1 Tax=Amycolatopsis sp. FBCC-B4732 TaxID=3079339 RepID=UPI001FF4DF58|nr:MarR family winged helix-turn-helix transcriptional regulator [Amycolatopsis sp. FBCC-B4732]UOX93066.1 MarR family winged helix-turn-helix transcriptional regulator [Amycolatopsis sp. FBCC-B4732]